MSELTPQTGLVHFLPEQWSATPIGRGGYGVLLSNSYDPTITAKLIADSWERVQAEYEIGAFAAEFGLSPNYHAVLTTTDIGPLARIWSASYGILMDRIDGCDLSRFLRGYASCAQLENVLTQFDALMERLMDFPHTHGDIKASNFMVAETGKLWLVDWGCADDYSYLDKDEDLGYLDIVRRRICLTLNKAYEDCE